MKNKADCKNVRIRSCMCCQECWYLHAGNDIWGKGIDVWESVRINATWWTGIFTLKSESPCGSGYLVFGNLNEAEESRMTEDWKRNVHYMAVPFKWCFAMASSLSKSCFPKSNRSDVACTCLYVHRAKSKLWKVCKPTSYICDALHKTVWTVRVSMKPSNILTWCFSHS